MSKASLVELAKKKSHKLITPEILKELNWSFNFYLIWFFLFKFKFYKNFNELDKIVSKNDHSQPAIPARV